VKVKFGKNQHKFLFLVKYLIFLGPPRVDNVSAEGEGSDLKFGPGATTQDIIDNKFTSKLPAIDLSLLGKQKI